MKITYNKNPLWTKIELDDHEKKELWYKIKIREMENMMFGAHFRLNEDDKYFDLEKARKQLDPTYWCTDEKSKLDERCDTLLDYYIGNLEYKHEGDCTCIACTCDKCSAEHLLDINTMPGLGKHSAVKIDSAFGKDNERTIEEALEHLKNYTCVRSGTWLNYPEEDFNKHIPRWQAEAKSAYEWLLKYKEQHFA